MLHQIDPIRKRVSRCLAKVGKLPGEAPTLKVCIQGHLAAPKILIIGLPVMFAGNSYDNRSYPSGDGYHYSNACVLCFVNCQGSSLTLLTATVATTTTTLTGPPTTTPVRPRSLALFLARSVISPGSHPKALADDLTLLQVVATPSTTLPLAILPSITGTPRTRGASNGHLLFGFP